MLDLAALCKDLSNPRSTARRKSDYIIRKNYEFLSEAFHLQDGNFGRTDELVAGWKEEFAYIYGNVKTNLSSNSKLKPEKVLGIYGIPYCKEREAEDVQRLFLAIQTQFCLLLKCMMYSILCPEDSHGDYESIILGTYTRRAGVLDDYAEDWYCWPVYELNRGYAQVMDELLAMVRDYVTDMEVVFFVRNNNYDYIKQMYEAIIPKELRHALGEYYTPDWLAEVTLKELCQNCKEPVENLSFMDPTCGSGTFLFKIIAAKRSRGADLQSIVQSVYGLDINPLAVLTARTNYLLAVLDLIKVEKPVAIPVYCADVVRLDRDKIMTRLPKVDVIIGNPPWVNWEYLPAEYRQKSKDKWTEYGLLSASGRDLSFSKEDISVLITYIVMDLLLEDGGVLGFVIRQGVFKSVQNGVGFRRFRIKDECGIKVLRVDDLSAIRVFENAVTSAAVFYARKGEETTYPVPYYLWQKRGDLTKCTYHPYSDMQQVLEEIVIRKQYAMPAVEGDVTSLWVTAKRESLAAMSRILGSNSYRARTGVFTGGANGVYWLRAESADEDKIRVSNVVERAKRKTQKVVADIEKTHVYPMLKGSNVKRWNTVYDTYLLCPHTAETKMWPVPGEALKEETPATYEYLSQFRQELDERKGFAGWEKEIQRREFHAILRIGEYTFSKYKVVWKYIASEFICAVIGEAEDSFLGRKPILPNEKIMYVGTNDEMEAYYLCGILSSTPVADCVRSYMNPTSISAHVLNKLNIPAFDRRNPDHVQIARVCQEGHGKENVAYFIEQIDEIVESMW